MEIIFSSGNGKVQVLYNPWKLAHYEVFVEGCKKCSSYTKSLAIRNAVAFAKDVRSAFFRRY